MLRVFSRENFLWHRSGSWFRFGGWWRAKKMGPSGPRALLVCVDRFASLSARGLHLRSRLHGRIARKRSPTRDASATIAEEFALPSGLPARATGDSRASAGPVQALASDSPAPRTAPPRTSPEPLHDLRGGAQVARRDVGERALPALAPGRALGLDLARGRAASAARATTRRSLSERVRST